MHVTLSPSPGFYLIFLWAFHYGVSECACMHATPDTAYSHSREEQRTSLKEHSREGYLNRFLFLPSAGRAAGGSSFVEFVWRNLYRALAERQLSRITNRPWRDRKREPLTSTSFTRSRDKWAKGRRKKTGKGENWEITHTPMRRGGMQSVWALEEKLREESRDCMLNIFSLRNVVNIFRAIQKILSVSSAWQKL